MNICHTHDIDVISFCNYNDTTPTNSNTQLLKYFTFHVEMCYLHAQKSNTV